MIFKVKLLIRLIILQMKHYFSLFLHLIMIQKKHLC